MDTPRTSRTWRAEGGKLGHEIEGTHDINDEFFPQARSLGFVEIDGGEELPARRSEELDPHLCPQPGPSLCKDLLGWEGFKMACIQLRDAPFDLFFPSGLDLRVPIQAGNQAFGELGPLLRREQKGCCLKGVQG